MDKIILAVLLGGWIAQVQAQTVDPKQIPMLSAEIKVDGQLDETVWKQALSIWLEIETNPSENIPALVDTEVLVFDNGQALLLGFRAEDPEPNKIRAFLRDRDAAFQDDFVGVILDTFNDERRALEFFVNPLGVQMDLIQDDVSGNEDASWNAIWDAAGVIGSDGFVVEMKIPYTALQLADSEGEQIWGIDFLRFYPRGVRHRLSAAPRNRNIACQLCQLAKYQGFSNASSGRDLEVTPTVTALRSEQREALTDERLIAGETEFEPGVDLSWGVTPNITLNATINPDFSQVEADVAQLDVNRRFTLFFPETRPFFLEGADFFSTPFRAVFTRNIADPDYGIRLTGKVGPNAYGAFLTNDTSTSFLVPGNQGSGVASLDLESRDAAFRYRRDVGENSNIGALLTARQADGYHNYVAGFDGRLRFTDVDSLRFQYLNSESEYPAEVVEEFDQPEGGFNGTALRLDYDHNERDWFAFARYLDISQDFRADLGFFRRSDFNRLAAGAGRIWYGGPDHWLSRLQLDADWTIGHDESGRFLERATETSIRVEGPLQSNIRVELSRRDRLADETVFREDGWNFNARLQPFSGVFLGLRGSFGDAIDFSNNVLADITRLSPEIRWNIGRHWGVQLRHTAQKLKRDEGEIFRANQSDLRLNYQLDLRQRFRLTVQYTDIERNQELFINEVDTRDRLLGTQFIYSYKINPRTVFFAGYSDSAAEDDSVDDLTTTGRSLFFKVAYAWEPS